MESKIMNLFELFGLAYNQKKHALPNPIKPRQRQCLQLSADPVRQVGDTSATYITEQVLEDEEHHSSWILNYNEKALKRTSKLSNYDVAIIQGQKNLQTTKYIHVKKLWSEGIGANKISTRLTSEHGRGYGKRTIETYISAINRANTMEAEKIPVFTPQNTAKSR